MIDFHANRIVVNDHDEPIKEWVVWFLTPEGTHPTLEEAKQVMETNGYPFNMIRPVPVARSISTYEVCLK